MYLYIYIYYIYIYYDIFCDKPNAINHPMNQAARLNGKQLDVPRRSTSQPLMRAVPEPLKCRGIM